MTQTWRTTNRVTVWSGEIAAGAGVGVRRTACFTRPPRAIKPAAEAEHGPESPPLAHRPRGGLESPQPEEAWLDLLADLIVEDLYQGVSRW